MGIKMLPLIFLYTAVIAEMIFGGIWFLTRKYQRELRSRDGFALVFMLWLGFASIAALPFYLYFPEMSFTDAFLKL